MRNYPAILTKSSLLIFFTFINLLIITGQATEKSHTTFVMDNLDVQNRFGWPPVTRVEKVIPLETNPNSILGTFTKGIVRENNILIYDSRNRFLKVFDEKGKYLFQVGTKGNGPGEYTDMRDFMLEGINIWCLDNKKINCFDLLTGRFKSSIKYETKNFNPTGFLLFNPDNYYLWQSNPYSSSKDPAFSLLEFKGGKQKNSFFKHDYFSVDGVRFLEGLNNSYNLIPVSGECKIYKITQDSIYIAFEIDFKNKWIPKDKLIKQPDYTTGNQEYLKSPYFKNINNIFETEEYLYFTCVGPNAMGYEVLINKQTRKTSMGMLDYYYTPRIFYSDAKSFYGYYNSTSFTKERIESSKSEFFNTVAKKIGSVNLEDNFVIVKLSLTKN
jgi:hypothetical protein